ATLSIGGSSNNYFSEYTSKYTAADHFSISHNSTPASRSAIMEKLQKYNLVLVQVNNTSWRAGGHFGYTSESDAMLQEVIRRKKCVVTFLSNPYLLSSLKNLDKTNALLIGYEDNDFSQKAAAEAIFGAIKVNGK
ncbi:MAG: hypothetical protein ACK452_00955, partial [Bacteroidota bacterium]